MTSERWQRVKELFAVASETEPSQRSAFLDQACADDASLRSELEGLLAAGGEAGTSFLKDPDITRELGGTFSATMSTRIGRRIGPYQLIEQIGIGGMGEVYRAARADQQYEKQVAIKLVRAGEDSKFVIDRFRNERQVLASLDHPSIARLLDGGTTEDGSPYFVMELIEGQPIDEYCDKHKLATTGRLILFLQVCSAVQYAHQRLIIFRDLKPGNILVTSDEVPKLLDFGIAKILDPATALDASEPTISMFRLLTPAYASPEQVKGEAITTASDVYSLGVVLYELLTGHRPYRTAGYAPHEIAQAVCEFEPERLSTALGRTETRESTGSLSRITPASVSAVRDGSPDKLRKRLRGDLDNIVLMALRKEPQHRYASVDQFATDIRRHLENLPVSASRGTLQYRTSKFVRRHKVGVTVALTVTAALLFALGLTLRAEHIARQQQLRAERRFNEVRVLANSLLFDIHDAIRDLPGATPVRKLLVQDALHYLDSLASEKSGDASLQRELAAAYTKIGDVQGNPQNANLGDVAGALASYRKALVICESLTENTVRSPEDLLALSRAYRNVGIAQVAAGAPRAGLENYARALDILKASASNSSSVEAQEQLAGLHWNIANADADLDDLDGALKEYRKSAAIREAIVSSDPKHSPRIEVRLAGSYGYMSDVFFRKHEYDEAIRWETKAVAIMKKLWDASPGNATYEEYFCEGLGDNGIYREERGDLQQAQSDLSQAIAGFESLYKADPNDVRVQRRIGRLETYLGLVLARRGHVSAGAAKLREALRVFQDLSHSDLNEGDHYLRAIADVYLATGRANSVAAAQRRLSRESRIAYEAAACTAYQESVAAWQQLAGLRQLSSSETKAMQEANIPAAQCTAR